MNAPGWYGYWIQMDMCTRIYGRVTCTGKCGRVHVVLHACMHVPTPVRVCTGTPGYTHTDKHACLTRHANTHRHMCVDTHIPPPRPGGGAFSPCVRPLQRDPEPRWAQQAHPSARSEHGSSCPSVTPDKGPVHVKAPPTSTARRPAEKAPGCLSHGIHALLDGH